MKISSSAYFAVESLVRLAAYDAKRPCSVEALSHSVGCSESFTEQLTTDVNGTAGAAPAPTRNDPMILFNLVRKAS